jgi:large subunit ribosomal protein L28
MAAVCEVCGKHPSFGMSVSHSHVRSKRRWNPNIQRVRAMVGGSPRRLSVCTVVHQGRQGHEGRPDGTPGRLTSRTGARARLCAAPTTSASPLRGESSFLRTLR